MSVLLRLEALAGFALILLILWDGFETMVLTRTVSRRWRLTGMYYFTTRPVLYGWLRRMTNGRRRHAILTAYPPLSLLVLFAVWAGILILGFAMVNQGIEARLSDAARPFSSILYYSGVTFLTLGYGDLAPRDAFPRVLAVTEAATGFLFLALVISYLPVFYGAIQRREVPILKLDARAGSMPTGHELIRRHAEARCLHLLPALLAEYERWGAELLETYLSYPVLCFYRSQHDEQSWLMTMTAILDACALIEATCEGEDDRACELRFQARATRAILRHTLVDLAYILRFQPKFDAPERLSREILAFILADLRGAGIAVASGEAAWERLATIRREYEPYAIGVGDDLLFTLPAWGRSVGVKDNWQIAAWDGQSHGASTGLLPGADAGAVGPDHGAVAEGEADSLTSLSKHGGAG